MVAGTMSQARGNAGVPATLRHNSGRVKGSPRCRVLVPREGHSLLGQLAFAVFFSTNWLGPKRNRRSHALAASDFAGIGGDLGYLAQASKQIGQECEHLLAMREKAARHRLFLEEDALLTSSNSWDE